MRSRRWRSSTWFRKEEELLLQRESDKFTATQPPESLRSGSRTFLYPANASASSSNNGVGYSFSLVVSFFSARSILRILLTNTNAVAFSTFDLTKEQKDALESGIVSMEDVQMAVAKGTRYSFYA